MYRARLAVLRLFALTLALNLVLVIPAASAAAGSSGTSKAPSKQPKTSQTRLAASIEHLLADPAVARSFWGIKAVSLDSGRTLFEQNAGKLFTPASNAKLFTTAATLALIGPEYQFRTTVETSGLIDKYGRVNGDLVLVGRGDPNLSGRVLPYTYPLPQRTLSPEWVLQDLADQLVQKGVKFVDGNIVGDDSYFAFERYGEGWSQQDVFWDYGAPVSALTLNDNTIFVTVAPGARPGDRAFIRVEPFGSYFQIDNRAVTTPAASGAEKLGVAREPGSNEITIWGNIPVNDAGPTYSLAISDPAEFAARVFRSILLQRGVAVYGGVRTHHADAPSLFTSTLPAYSGGGDTLAAITPVQPLVLASYESHPLVEDLRIINKESQNLHAEIMLRLLGREKGSGGSIEGGGEVVKGFLSSAGISPDEYVLLDGSGLSRQDLVTPDAVIKLLTYINSQPWGNTFRQTLPIAGTDGTLAFRFRNTAAQGRVLAKTGTLGHVNALSGYATTLSGDHVVFSIMANNHNLGSHSATQVMDEIVEAIVNDLPPRPRKKRKKAQCCASGAATRP
jgi:D-alanyl-D-alanine carboxypeptidase/D-alanyl-D-alanine-endopeptidase (penicillin-binding protein 4)